MTLLAHSDAANPWEHHPHPDVWLLIAILVIGYAWAVRRRRPAGVAPVSRREMLWFGLGIAALWGFSDWPVHELSEDWLFSVHMTQHTVFSLVAPPLLLLGTPRWMLSRLARPVLPLLRRLARPIPATLAFNAVVVFTHWPVWVNLSVRNEGVHFVSHVVLFGTAVVMWIPALSRIPELPTLAPPLRMLYLFVQSIVPTVPASFLAFAERPLYQAYVEAPRAFGVTAVEDQQIAGAVMKIGGAALIWGVIIVVFFRWYAQTERDKGDVLTWEDVERELERTTPPVSPTG